MHKTFFKTDLTDNRTKKEKPKKLYTIKKISEKKKQRLKEGGELPIFIEIWTERPHICTNCGKPIKLFHPSCFAHIKSKLMYPELRLDKNNINLVHGIWEIKEDGQTYNCHKELDTKNAKCNK